MARIKFTALVESIRGTIAGTTFQKNAFGYTVKAKPNMVRPNTPRQTTQKVLFQRALQAWSTLSATDRGNWDTYASNFPTPSKNNPDAYLTGFNLFVRWHSLAFMFQSGTLGNPNGAQGSALFNEFIVTNDTGVLTWTLNVTLSQGPWRAFVYLTRPLKPTQNFVKSWTRFISQIQIVSDGDDDIITADYQNVFGQLPQPGDLVGYDVTLLNTTNAQVIYLPTAIVTVE